MSVIYTMIQNQYCYLINILKIRAAQQLVNQFNLVPVFLFYEIRCYFPCCTKLSNII